jgi:hypothetical protein
MVDSPSIDPNAPYTPVVLSLIAPLEPTNPPALAQVQSVSYTPEARDKAFRICRGQCHHQ